MRASVDWTGFGALAAAVLGLALAAHEMAAAQSGAPPPAAVQATQDPKLQAALKKADGGDAGALVALADGGAPDAQYYAAVMYLFGRGAVAKDPVKGCAYAQKASEKRGDAMHLVGMCYAGGAGGTQDSAKAETAYTRATAMGYPKSKCALGQMLMADPSQAARGLGLCKEAAEAGDADAQEAVADAYYNGSGVKSDHAEARRWYEKAAKQNDPNAARRLGEMYARGDGGKKDTKKAIEYWTIADKAGDPLVAILVADQLFSDMTGGRKPGPGTYAFKGGVPTGNISVVEEWYQLALDRDPRPDVKERAKYALAILGGFKTGVQSTKRPKS